MTFERLKILFWGVEWGHANIYYVDNNKATEKLQFKQIVNPHISSLQDPKDILGFEIDGRCTCKRKILELVETFPLDRVCALYFVIEKKTQLPFVMDIVEEFSLGKPKLYGIDPDYFFSLVPLSGNSRRLVEKYILGLKSDYSFRGTIIRYGKQVLIYAGLSALLYEGFVVTVFRKPVSLSSNTQNPDLKSYLL
jgi:hypothetical protein